MNSIDFCIVYSEIQKADGWNFRVFQKEWSFWIDDSAQCEGI